MPKKTVLYSLLALLFFSCGRQNEIITYRGNLLIKDTHSIPFRIEYDVSTSTYSLHNGEENIAVDHSQKHDSIVLDHPVFNSQLVFVETEDSLIGYWYNLEKGDYKMSFVAFKDPGLFLKTNYTGNVSGYWDVTFGDDGAAIGIFEQEDDQVTGTFLTETGDYRYLIGQRQGNLMLLSTFDMAHAFLFIANVNDEGQMVGEFYSGNHYYERWIAEKDDDAKLRPADELVEITDSVKANFLFTGLSGERIDIDHPLFEGKAIVLQLFGSWCPNCYDESIFLNEVFTSNAYKNVAFMGVAFEKTKTFEDSKQKIERFRNGLSIEYPLCYGGVASKDTARSRINNIDVIRAFPTLLFYNKEHELLAVHSGFSGPGTGKHYLKSKEEIQRLLELIEE